MIYEEMTKLLDTLHLENPHFILGIDKALELREHCELSIGRPIKGLSQFGGWQIIVDPDEFPYTCKVEGSSYPVDSHWEE